MHLIFKEYIEQENYKTIYFCMGCFWGTEKLFWNVAGVVYTEVGYANPNIDNPSCGDVFRPNVFHREVVKVTYDSSIISLISLLAYFFENHTIDNPASAMVPEPYRSSIFYDNEKTDVALIKDTMAQYSKSRLNRGKTDEITTEIIKLKKYIKAKDEHQQYMLKHEDVFCAIRFNGIKLILE